MGLLIDGVWRERGYDIKTSRGEFVRQESAFRDWITGDGSSGFKAQAGRYRLYASFACPWASRTLIFRKLKNLVRAIDVTVVNAMMSESGWILPDGQPLHTIYTRVKPDYTGRVTLPVLWDSEQETIINNESSEIIRMLNSEFDSIGASGPDFYPENLRNEIDEINAFIYDNVNNGVYKTGFATSQDAYDDAVFALFGALDELEDRLGRQRYLVGNVITEADWRLFTTLVRFDSVYVGHFKCNLRRLVDYPNLWAYTRELYQVPGIAETVNFGHIKRHYFESHLPGTPAQITAAGPIIDFDEPHRRDTIQTAINWPTSLA